MTRRATALIALCIIAPLCCTQRAVDDSTKDKFDLLAQPLIEREHTMGVVVAVIEGDETQIFSYGVASAKSKSKPDPNTVFAIGSITKTFTTLLLADMVQRGVVSLDEPVGKFLPSSVAVPKKGDRKITLGDLATHMSGLPRVPTDWAPKDRENPYADYTAERMYKWLSSYDLPRAPGEKYEYSNLGSGLLGHTLELHEQKSLEKLIVERICKPLGMDCTSIRLRSRQRWCLAQGHDIEGNPVRYWDFDVLAGCGALYSTASDMVCYLKAQMGLVETPLSTAMEASHKPRHPAALPGCKMGLGWHLYHEGNVAWHDGGTYGFYAYAGFDKKKKFGFVWLSNSSLFQLGGLRVRLEKILLGQPIEPMEFKEAIDLEPEVLEQYVGEYEIAPEVIMKVALIEGYLVLSAPGQQGGSVLYPESETEFFFMETEDVTVSFEKAAEGSVTALVFHEADEETRAQRVSGACAER